MKGEQPRSPLLVTRITDFSALRRQTREGGWFMPILFMALVALTVFIVMGLMLFYAAYKESKEKHQADVEADEREKTASHVAG